MGKYSLESSRVADSELNGNYMKSADGDNGSSHGSSMTDGTKTEVVKPTMVGVREVVSVHVYFCVYTKH